MTLRIPCLGLLVFVLAGCGTNERAYSPEEVRSAFSDVGLPLVVGAETHTDATWSGTLFAGKTEGDMLVFVYDGVKAARRAMDIERSQVTPTSFDRRLRNVVVTSEDLPSTKRHRVLAALVALRRSRK